MSFATSMPSGQAYDQVPQIGCSHISALLPPRPHRRSTEARKASSVLSSSERGTSRRASIQVDRPPRRAAPAASSRPLHACRLHYDFVEHALKSKADTLDRTTYFLFYILFVVGFSFYFLYDVDVSARYQLRHSLLDTFVCAEMPRLKSAKRFAELSSANDYSAYVVYAVAPLLADVLAPTGSSIPLGAMRIRTQRSATTGYSSLPADKATSLYTIVTSTDGSAHDDTRLLKKTWFDLEKPWRYCSCAELGGSRYVRLHGALGTYHCGGFLFDAPLWVPRSNTNSSSTCLGTAEQAFPFAEGTLPYQRISLEMLQNTYLRQLFWEASASFLDSQATRVVVTEVLFYNPALQFFATVKLIGEVTSGGSWRTSALLRTARVWTRADVGKGVYDAVVMLLALVWLVVFVAQAAAVMRRRVAEHKSGGGGDDGRVRPRGSTGMSCSGVSAVRILAIADYVFDPQNLTTLAILCLLVITAGFRIASVVYCARSVPRLDEIIYQNRYPIQLEYLFFLSDAELYTNAVLLLLLFYRGLCFITIDTHAARVVHVLARSQSALCGYLLLTLFSTTAYALTLTTLFGDSVWAFHNVDSAFYSLIQVMARQHDVSALIRGANNEVLLAFLLYSYAVIGVLAIFSVASGILVRSFSAMRREEPTPASAGYQIRWLLRRARARLTSPRQWHWFVWRWCWGYGDAALLRHAACCLRCYRAATHPALGHAEGELRQLLSVDDFTEAMRHFSSAPSLSSLSSASSASPSSKTLSGCRRGIWMTWTTHSSSCTSSSSEWHRNGSDRSGSGSNHGAGDSAELVKLRATPAEQREGWRREWQQRWGSYTPEEIWHDVCRDWLASATSEASLYYQEEAVWLRNGVQAAVGDNLSRAKAFPQRLAELERKLKLLESHLRENELTAVGSDKVNRDDKADNES